MHVLKPGPYGEGSLCEYASRPLAPEHLEYLRSLHVSSASLLRRAEEVDREIDARLDRLYPATVAVSAGGRAPSSARRTYASVIPAHRRAAGPTVDMERSRTSSTTSSPNGRLQRECRPSTQTTRITRTPSIEVVESPLARCMRVHLFTHVCCPTRCSSTIQADHSLAE